MSNLNPPRYLPTLTEVVTPEAFIPSEPTQWSPEPQPVQAAPTLSADDTAQIVQSALAKVTPMLEQQLRNAAHELFEVQVNMVLPALHRHVEAAVRQAIQEALTERGSHTHESNS